MGAQEKIIERARELAVALLERRAELLDKGEDDALEELCALVSAPEFRLSLAGVSSDIVTDEAGQRRLSALGFVSDEDLLTEARRRGLSLVTLAVSDREFDQRVRKAGYRKRLAEFPLNEINSYLRIQQSD